MTAMGPSAGRTPRASVVITAYNDLRFLDEAVASVLAQDFPDLELIVVDDGNEDKSAFAGLEARDPRLRLLVNPHNVGTAVAANRGIAASRGGIIVRLDADDVCEPARVGRLVEALDADSELGLVGSAATMITEDGAPQSIERLPESDVEIRWTMLFRNPFFHSAVAFRRTLFDEVGGYRAHELISQDYYLWAALVQCCRARNLAEPLVRYRVNSRGLIARNATNWRGRTHAVRKRLWDGIKRVYDLYTDTPAMDINRFQGGMEIPPERRAAAYKVMQDAFEAFKIAPRAFDRPEDQDEIERLGGALAERIAASPALDEPEPAPSLEYAHWYHGKALSTDWSSIYFQNWASLFAARRDQPLDILEIGSWEGRSAIFFLNFFGNATLTCVDTFAGSVEHSMREHWAKALPLIEERFDANLAEFGSRLEKIRSASAAALEKLASEERRYDLVYIDGSHKCDDARADAFGVWPMVRAHGIVIFDDYEWSFFDDPALLPKRGVDDFLAAHAGQYDEIYRGYQLVIQRRAVSSATAPLG
jgi:glycosyltransferase involved in cell wall biosynthesis/predicted O-methyltransferase YrrM